MKRERFTTIEGIKTESLEELNAVSKYVFQKYFGD